MVHTNKDKMMVPFNLFPRLYSPVLVTAVLVLLFETNNNSSVLCFHIQVKSIKLQTDVVLRRFTMNRWTRRQSKLSQLSQTKTTKAIIITEKSHSGLSHAINIIDETNRWTSDCNCSFDLSSPREWLESSPYGVYTVIRCDGNQHQSRVLISVHDNSKYRWRAWGIDFHLQRLIDSYKLMFGAVEEQPMLKKRTLSIINHCLRSAEKDWIQSGNNTNQTSMVTILWYPDQTDMSGSKSRINVAAHISPTSFSVSSVLPLSLVIATPSSLYPSRKSSYPQAKFSSWCSTRRPLEKAFRTFTEPKEIILADETIDGDATLLEGLTSNLFCVFKPDNVIRTTTTTAVLAGFAQQIIIDTASELGYSVDLETPIRMSDSSLWKEVFITSSVKMMTPIRRVLIPRNDTAKVADGADNQLSFEEIWSFQNNNTHLGHTQSCAGCTYQRIYNHILHNATNKYYQYLDGEW